jgi:hypothetical protein
MELDKPDQTVYAWCVRWSGDSAADMTGAKLLGMHESVTSPVKDLSVRFFAAR